MKDIKKIEQKKLSQYLSVHSDPKKAYKEFKTLWKSEEGKERILKGEEDALLRKISLIECNESLLLLAETKLGVLGAVVTQVAKDLFQEFDCRTSSEMIMAQFAAEAFVRAMDVSRELSESRPRDFLTSNQIRYVNHLSKELDRANRQYANAIQNLRNLKCPPIELKVNADAAFFGQNQQFNQVKNDTP